MSKHLKLAACALLIAAGFTACDDDDETTTKTTTYETTTVDCAYVVNQGNYYSGVAGTLDMIDLEAGTVTSGVFYSVNSQSLGDTPQQAIVYGSKIYVPVYASDLVWVLDAYTLEILAQVSTASPEAVCGDGAYVFISNNDGYVTRMDTLTFSANEQLAVGPNPCNMTAANSMIYVSISDGYNYTNSYADGKQVVAIDTESFTIAETFAVGTNPGPIVADDEGNVYVVARGDYYLELPLVQKIATDGTVTDFADGTLLAYNDGTLYIIDYTADYVSNVCDVTAAAYSTSTASLLSDWELDADNLPLMPNAIDINPVTGDLYICSDNSPYGYSEDGYVYVYSADGTYQTTYDVGIHPYGVVFPTKYSTVTVTSE